MIIYITNNINVNQAQHNIWLTEISTQNTMLLCQSGQRLFFNYNSVRTLNIHICKLSIQSSNQLTWRLYYQGNCICWDI